eukprot:scaffold236117_cov28-Tisochrysis_lutea.AAC.6
MGMAAKWNAARSAARSTHETPKLKGSPLMKYHEADQLSSSTSPTTRLEVSWARARRPRASAIDKLASDRRDFTTPRAV